MNSRLDAAPRYCYQSLALEIALCPRFDHGREMAAVTIDCNTRSMLKGPEMIGSLHTALRKIRQRVGRVDKRARLFDEAEWELYERVREFTMTSPERVCALAKAVEYVARNDIEGAIVECGVWRGGSMMAVAYSLLAIGCTRYDLYLFDTFSGMVQPSRKDGDAASEKLKRKANDKHGWCLATLDDVRANLAATGYPASRIHFVQGRVEDTIPGFAPGSISLLRLDADWYESTKHDLEHLYPRLTPGGVLVIDDYGSWPGCRKAVDEFFAESRKPLLLNRIDRGGRIAVKPHCGPLRETRES